MVEIDSNDILQKYIARATIVSMILLSLTSCRISEEVRLDTTSQANPAETIEREVALEQPIAVRPPQPAPQNPPKILPSNLSPQMNSDPASAVTIDLYQPDMECKTLIPEPVAVESAQSLSGAIAKVLQARNTADFSVVGYRIRIDEGGLATVDLRLHPESPRKFVSLSMCEQFSLFGSLRETLINHSDWQIKAVQFTERGKPIQL